MPTNWMLVSGADNFEVSRRMGFVVAGMKERHRRKAERVQSGDRVLFYLTGIQKFGGTATATDSFFEDRLEPIWAGRKAGEYPYPWRFSITPNCILLPEQFVAAEALLPRLEWVHKWPAAHWQLAFQGNVHVLSDADFGTIEQAIRAAAASPAGDH
ncbi:MAG TPA: EVE domain-containing protein [Chloroflexota bacterium]|nr:EVE domain-containing protein [Chloroflexota bacterium]